MRLNRNNLSRPHSPALRGARASFERPGKTALLFPGQGLQYVGMGAGLYNRFATAREVFDSAGKILEYTISEMIFNPPKQGTPDLLNLTIFTQPAMFVTSVAYLEVLRKDLGFTGIDFVAGHSLGEYSALFAAGALPFKETLKLVTKRAIEMDNVCEDGPKGGMAAVLRTPPGRTVAELISMVRDSGVLGLALDNSPKNTVISGDDAAVLKACSIAGYKLKKLPVSGAFHSPLMAAAEKALGPVLAAITFAPEFIPYVANATGQINTDATRIGPLLLEQIQKPVLWRQTIATLWSLGVRTFIEVGPGKGIATMTTDCLEELNITKRPVTIISTDSNDKTGDLAAAFLPAP